MKKLILTIIFLLICSVVYSQSEDTTIVDTTTTENIDSLQTTNIITPNNDGFNDSFILKTNNESSITIYDRWSHEIYSQTGNELIWKPQLNQSSGVYFWFLHDKKLNKYKTGSVTLLK